MTDYQKPYFVLFNAITDALEEMGHLDLSGAARLLQAAQARAEEIILLEE